MPKTNPPADSDSLRVAIYARVSTADQHCEVQLGELRRYVKTRGWSATEYVDEGFSGKAVSWASRPALKKLMEDARARRIDLVLVWKLDRFGRSLLNLIQSIDELTACGVGFHAVVDNIDTSQSNPMARLLLHIMGAFAEYEREMIRERTRAGVRRAMQLGKKVGRPKAVFRRDRAVEMAGMGKSQRDIADELKVSVGTVNALLKHWRSERSKTPPKTPPPSAAKRKPRK